MASMSAKSSKALIEELLAADLGDRHFSVWTLKEQGEAIKRCGLASSQFKNRTETTEILTILHETELPTDHLTVLTLIAELGLPPSGARSKQQFSFYLLSFMCEKLKFPPWDPVPVLSVVVPKDEILRDQVSIICSERILDLNERPHAYIHRPNNQVAKLFSWVFVGCKRAVSQCIREQFDTSQQATDDTVYVGDEVSARVVSACACVFHNFACACVFIILHVRVYFIICVHACLFRPTHGMHIIVLAPFGVL